MVLLASACPLPEVHYAVCVLYYRVSPCLSAIMLSSIVSTTRCTCSRSLKSLSGMIHPSHPIHLHLRHLGHQGHLHHQLYPSLSSPWSLRSPFITFFTLLSGYPGHPCERQGYDMPNTTWSGFYVRKGLMEYLCLSVR